MLIRILCLIELAADGKASASYWSRFPGALNNASTLLRCRVLGNDGDHSEA